MTLLLLLYQSPEITWSPVLTLYAREYLRLLPDSQVEINTTAVYNRVYGVVQGSNTVAVATYDAPGDPLAYSSSPRECTVSLPQGSDSAAQALVDAVLEQRRRPQVLISNLQVRLADGLRLQRGQRVRLGISRCYLAEDLYVLGLVYDVTNGTCQITVGHPGAKAMSDTDVLVAVAAQVKELAT